jgi:hypothetical protein
LLQEVGNSTAKQLGHAQILPVGGLFQSEELNRAECDKREWVAFSEIIFSVGG